MSSPVRGRSRRALRLYAEPVPTFLIYGTFMSGQPGHENLDGARFLEQVETAPEYRLYEVDGRWPALVQHDDGVSITAELY